MKFSATELFAKILALPFFLRGYFDVNTSLLRVRGAGRDKKKKKKKNRKFVFFFFFNFEKISGTKNFL